MSLTLTAASLASRWSASRWIDRKPAGNDAPAKAATRWSRDVKYAPDLRQGRGAHCMPTMPQKTAPPCKVSTLGLWWSKVIVEYKNNSGQSSAL